MSDGVPDKSGVTLLIPVSLRVSAQGEKLVSTFAVLLAAMMLWALYGVTGAPLAANSEIS